MISSEFALCEAAARHVHSSCMSPCRMSPVACRLPIWHDVCDSDALWRRALVDIAKTRDGFQRTPLMAGIGTAAFVNDITEVELLAAVRAVRTRAMHYTSSHMHAAMSAGMDEPQQQHVPALQPLPPPATDGLRAVPRSREPAVLV